MKIIVDKEAKDVITKLCGVVLQVGGAENLVVLAVLNNMKDYDESGKEDKPKVE